ncbi:hypothetical protein ABOM_009498 [Aspergillus bombycis]|uniref:Heterokaryon incompatibility domain-containing protein n=1 Tax=Aspergillus bombycis TaxID=109264 RepID=A0A1F7ZRE7_9EURO|nr:hypothetical protein ABOM_009498 [Aspergillus bombycis]OGM42014.1 hypothetical protein ABOM_009498 [Aspergillus bombycis]
MASKKTEIIPSSSSPYLYSPLPEGHIRLLRLMPHQDRHAPIQCQLFDYPLHDSAVGTHRYEALSYVWGAPEKPHFIFLDKGSLSVTTNLHAALLHLRDHFIERVIWIDAICINQNDTDERRGQVQFMAKIYAKASCVVVWLEDEATSIDDDQISDEGGRALEVIRKAANAHYRVGIDDEKAVLALLWRPWFRRVWVLQEIAAARHVLIACHSAEIDGHAFSSGLTALQDIITNADMRNRIDTAVFLIKNATLRSKRVMARSDRFSLHIRPIADLITMYHNCEATDRRDKIYALLGMSSDTHAPAAILPDYTVPWKDALCRLIKFYIGTQACVQTWDDEDIAVIRGKGCVLGVVSQVKLNSSKDDPWDDSYDACVTVQMTGEHSKGEVVPWELIKWPGLVREGDIVCLLQGASRPTLIRPYDDHCVVITLGFVPVDAAHSAFLPTELKWGRLDGWNGFLRSVAVYTRNFLLVWDHQESSGILENGKDRRWLMDSRVPEDAKKTLEVELPKLHRLQNLGLILVDSEEFEQALENFPQSLDLYGPKAEKAYLPIFTEMMKIAMSSRRRGLPEQAERLENMVNIARRRGDFAVIKEETIVRMVTLSIDNIGLVRFLFTQRGDEVLITEKVLEEAARNPTCGDRLMTLIIEQFLPEVQLTEKVLLAAAKNPRRDIMRAICNL